MILWSLPTVLLLAVVSTARCGINDWSMHSFAPSGSSYSRFVAGPLSNGAVLFEANGTSVIPGLSTISDVPPITGEPASVVVDSDENVYWGVGSTYYSTGYDGTPRWTYVCSAGLAITTPALLSGSNPACSLFVMCSAPASGISGSVGHCLNKDTGKSAADVWMVNGWVVAHPIAVPGAVIVAGLDGSVASYTNDLKQMWTLKGLSAPVAGTPCFDGRQIFVFTVDGTVYSVDASNGGIVWQTNRYAYGAGPIAGCAVSQDGNYVAAGYTDGNVFMFTTTSSNNAMAYCAFPAGAPVLTSVVEAGTGAPFYVAANNALHAFIPSTGVCTGVGQTASTMYGAQRPAVDANGTAYVGYNGGVAAVNFGLGLFTNAIMWNQSTTGDVFQPVALSPYGTVYAPARSGMLYAIGATAASLIYHERDAVMMATANPQDLGALSALNYLCSGVSASVKDYLANYPFTLLDAALLQALNGTCAMYGVVATGNNPSGMPPNYASFQDASLYLNELSDTWQPQLAQLELEIAFMEAVDVGMKEKIAFVGNVTDEFAGRLDKLNTSLYHALDMLFSIEGSIEGIEGRVVLNALALEAELITFGATWFNMSMQFAAAAKQLSTQGMANYSMALSDFGRAMHTSVASLIWNYITDEDQELINEIEQGMAALGAAVVDFEQAAVDAELAATYMGYFLELTQLASMFQQMNELNKFLLSNNHTLPQLTPEMINQALNMDEITSWLTIAKQVLMQAGATSVYETIDAYISDTKALIVADLAYFVAYQQVQNIEAKMNSLFEQFNQLQQYMQELESQDLGAAVALNILYSQAYSIQLRTLEVANRACVQYLYWTLEPCQGTCPMAPYPTSAGVASFVEGFQQCINNPPPTPNTISGWFDVFFSNDTHPDAFRDWESGHFALELQLPTNATGVNVRTKDIGAYVLPTSALSTNFSEDLFVTMSHVGLSSFMNSNGQMYQFQHSPFENYTFILQVGTHGCPSGSQLPCLPPQCASTYNLSPYGLWEVFIPPGAYTPGIPIRQVALRFQVELQVIGAVPDPNALTMFTGPDSMKWTNSSC